MFVCDCVHHWVRVRRWMYRHTHQVCNHPSLSTVYLYQFYGLKGGTRWYTSMIDDTDYLSLFVNYIFAICFVQIDWPGGVYWPRSSYGNIVCHDHWRGNDRSTWLGSPDIHSNVENTVSDQYFKFSNTHFKILQKEVYKGAKKSFKKEFSQPINKVTEELRKR